MKKIISFFLALLMMSSFAIPSFASTGAYDSIQVTDSSPDEAVEEEKISFSERILEYGTSNIIEDGKLYVIIEHEYSDLGKTFDASYFPELEIESIEDISGANDKNATKEEYGPRWADFRNVICITLKSKTVSDMIDAVKKLDHRADTDLYSVTVGYDNIEFVSNGTPNDSNYYEQSDYYDLINLPEAWNITTGSSSVKVAVIEQEIVNHNDIDDNLITGYDFINNETETNDIVSDDPNHGVAVAGVIGAEGNNSAGISGVCWDVSIVPIQTNLADASMFSEVLSYLMANDIKIVNCSQSGISLTKIISGDGPEDVEFVINSDFAGRMKQQINNYTGILICSAGNDGANNDIGENFSVNDLKEDTYPTFPASFNCHNIISVGASTRDDAMWCYGPGKDKASSWGATSVDLFAPGESVYSTNTENSYSRYTGTSFSAPIVSGVAALMMSVNPNLTPLQIKSILLNTVDIIDYTGTDVPENLQITDKCVSGGRINAYKAVSLAKRLADNDPTLTQNDINKSNYLFHASTGEVVKYLGKEVSLTIPQTINGAIVTKIASSAFSLNIYVSRITIPGNITSIGQEAFSECTHLISVVIPSSVTSIPIGAFKECSALKEVTLPRTLQTIGNYAFAKCSSLQTVSLPASLSSIGASSFDDTVMIYAPYDGVAYNYAISSNMAVCAISGNSVHSYSNGGYSIYSKDIKIPSTFFGTTITSIAGHAFDGADDIRSVEIPSTVTTIGYRSFRNCTALRTLIIPTSVTSISNSMNSNILEGSTNAIIYCSRSSYTWLYAQSSGITCIGITTDTASKTASVTLISEADGWGTEYYIPETFAGCTVTSIADSAFYIDPATPTNMTKVFVPETVESIGNNAFTNSPNMTDIYIYSDETTIGADCFNAYNKANLTVHCYVTSPALVYAAINGYNIATF